MNEAHEVRKTENPSPAGHVQHKAAANERTKKHSAVNSLTYFRVRQKETGQALWRVCATVVVSITQPDYVCLQPPACNAHAI
jgi:hypothetical protein